MARGLIYRALRSTKAQLLVTLAAALVAGGFLASRGLPPDVYIADAVYEDNQIQVRRLAYWNVLGEGQTTPLHHAAMLGKVEAAAIALGCGVAVDAKDADGWTALCYAANEPSDEVADERGDGGRLDEALVRLLVEHGADVNTRTPDNRTPLHGAAARGHAGIVRLLLDHGADTNVRDWAGNTPLGVAVALHQDEVGDLLRQHGAKE